MNISKVKIYPKHGLLKRVSLSNLDPSVIFVTVQSRLSISTCLILGITFFII